MGSNKKLRNQPALALFSKKWINKYSIVTLLFVCWMLFFDKHDFFTKRKLDKTIEKLEAEAANNLSLIEAAKKEKLDIELNKEKYAREQYFMHKPSEDVIIIDRKKE